MIDEQQFATFKQKWVAENDAKFGSEIDHEYGNQAHEANDRHIMNLTEREYQHTQDVEEQLGAAIRTYLQTEASPTSELGHIVFELHQSWLQLMVPHYTVEMHREIVKLYIADPRFGAYYTKLAGDDRAAQVIVDTVLANG